MEVTVSAPAKSIPISPNTKLEEILRIYDAQQKNKQNVKDTSISQRLKKIKKLRKTVLAKREEIQQALWADFHKPAMQVDITEIYPIISECKHFEENLDYWSTPTEANTPLLLFGTYAKIIREPKGSVLLLTPWNYPFQIPLRNLVAAVAAGNVAIIKPSEFAPNTSAIIRKVVSEVFSENEVAIIDGDHTVSQELLKLKWDHIHFTGAPIHGKSVMKAAAENLTPVTLELGGKSPAIIDDTANLKATARNFLWGKFVNSGQTCVAVDYVLIDEKKKDEFISILKETIKGAFGENPQASGDDCRIINARHYARVKRLLDDAVSKGAKVEIGGNTDANENYIAPTVLCNVSPDMLVMEEEIFGPLVPIVTYKTLEEAVRIINSKEKPLALYIYSGRSKNQDYIINHTSAGATCINESMIHNGNSNLPFGGINNSGIGKSHGEFGYKEFTNERPVLTAWNAPTKLLLPPYKGWHKTLANIILKYL
ncbi:MAG: aldehyde dehydrogenase family protein [Chitinophagales bacterium]